MTYEFIYEDEDNNYDCEVDLKVYYERNYGADADGNRGTEMYFTEIEDFRVFLDGYEVKDKDLISRCQDYFDRFEYDKASSDAIDAYND